MFASVRPETKSWVAPAESARTRSECSTRPGSSPGSWPYLVLRREGTDRLVQQLEVVVASFEPALPGRSFNASALRSCRTSPEGDGSHSRACSLHLAIRSGELREPVHRIGSLVVVAVATGGCGAGRQSGRRWRVEVSVSGADRSSARIWSIF